MGFNNLASQAVSKAVQNLQARGSVVDLGNQTLKNTKVRAEIYHRLGIVAPVKGLSSVKEWYLSLGFQKYMAIDVNEQKDAVAMDLNLDLGQHYGFHEQFDLVTNNGTSEHVFHQQAVFKNCHDLCRVGGIMLHILPFYRWVDHGFYNYNPNLFTALSSANSYILNELWIATSDGLKIHSLDVENPVRNDTYRSAFDLDAWERDPLIVAMMTKTSADQFRIPIQHRYGGANITDPEISERYQ